MKPFRACKKTPALKALWGELGESVAYRGIMPLPESHFNPNHFGCFHWLAESFFLKVAINFQCTGLLLSNSFPSSVHRGTAICTGRCKNGHCDSSGRELPFEIYVPRPAPFPADCTGICLRRGNWPGRMPARRSCERTRSRLQFRREDNCEGGSPRSPSCVECALFLTPRFFISSLLRNQNRTRDSMPGGHLAASFMPIRSQKCTTEEKPTPLYATSAGRSHRCPGLALSICIYSQR